MSTPWVDVPGVGYGRVVDVQQGIPEPWATVMRAKGFIDQRGSSGEPSLRQLAKAAGISVETVRRLVHGEGDSSGNTLIAVADALGKPVTEVSRWAKSRPPLGPWKPPPESTRLTRAERRVLEELVRVMVAGSGDVVTPIGLAASEAAGPSEYEQVIAQQERAEDEAP